MDTLLKKTHTQEVQEPKFFLIKKKKLMKVMMRKETNEHPKNKNQREINETK